MTKPMLASDAVEEKIKYPCIIQPKVDGVRGINMHGYLTGRSLKAHANIHNTQFFSMGGFRGFDGELAAEDERHPDLCRLTTSAVSTIEGSPWLLWHVFDYLTPETKALPYHQRLAQLKIRYEQLRETSPSIVPHIKPITSVWCEDYATLLQYDAQWLSEGYEGTIVRDPQGMHKEGRSTVREGGLLRIKRFIDAEAVVTGFEEGESNENEAQINELGLQFRSSHKANKVSNKMIGSMTGRLTADVSHMNKKLFKQGELVKISPGKLTEEERLYYFANPLKLLGQVSKFKLFPKGIKDKPRFPTHQSFKALTDMHPN